MRIVSDKQKETSKDLFQFISFKASLKHFKKKYCDKLKAETPTNSPVRFPSSFPYTVSVAGAIISAANCYLHTLRTGNKDQRAEYKYVIQEKRYLRVRTSRGQIARFANFFVHDEDMGLDSTGKPLYKMADVDPEGYENAKKRASVYIKQLLDDTEFIKGKRLCHCNGFGGLELHINWKWLRGQEKVDSNGQRSDCAYPQNPTSYPQSEPGYPHFEQSYPHPAQNRAKIHPQNQNPNSADFQKVTKNFLADSVLTNREVSGYNKKDHNRDAANEPSAHLIRSASLDAIEEKKKDASGDSVPIASSGKEKSGRKVDENQRNFIPPPRGKFAMWPAELAHFMPDNFFTPQRYQSLHFRGNDMYRTAHKLMNIFYWTVIPAADYKITGWEYRHGIGWMEDLLFHAMYSGEEILTLEQGFLKMCYCINILLEQIAKKRKSEKQADREWDYLKYRLKKYFSLEVDDKGEYVMQKGCFRVIIDKMYEKEVHRKTRIKYKHDVYNRIFSKAKSIVTGKIKEFHGKVVNDSGEIDAHKRFEITQKHEKFIVDQLMKNKILTKNHKVRLRNYYITATSLGESKFD